MTQRTFQQDDLNCSPTQTLSRLVSFLLVAAFCLVSAISFPTRAIADSAPASTSSMTTETIQSLPESTDIPADKVDQFAGAYLKVLRLLSDRETELPAAETSAEALKVQQSIEAEAVALIEDSGLTMPEYMQILSLASQDVAFRDKVLGRMDESVED